MLTKATCSKCGREEQINDYIAERLEKCKYVHYVCGYCNAERGAKAISEIFDRTFGGK